MAKYTGKVIPVEQEPGFGEQAGAFAYGAATGLVGGPGEFEKFAAYDVPEFFGADVKRGELIPFGRETVFPTVEESQKILGKVGISKPREAVSGAQTAGEVIGGLATAVPGLIRGGKALYGTDLVQSLLGRKTREQAAKLAEEAQAAGKTGQEAIAARSAETARQAEGAAARQAALQEEALGRAKLAEETAAKEAARGGRSLRNLFGVRTLPEAGAFRPIPETPAQVGNYIRQQAENFVNAIKNRRSQLAEKNISAVMDDAKKLESSNQFIQNTSKFGELVKYLDGRLKVVTDPTIRSQLEVIKTALTKGAPVKLTEGERRVIALRENKTLDQIPEQIFLKPTFEGVEIMRRRIGDAAFGVPEEGYKAIGQGMAKDIYSKLSDAMKDYSKPFSKYLEDYKRLSEPIEVYGTKIGKGLTETVDAGGKYYAKTAEQVAKDIFSSPEKYAQFVDAVGGNKQIAEAAARRYFAGVLETAKTPEAFQKVMRDNRALLGTGGPLRSLAKELEFRYLQPMQKAETRVAAAGAEASKSKTAAEQLVKEAKQFDKDFSDVLKNVKGSEELFSDAVKALASAKPKDAIKIFDNTVLPKLRQAEEKAGVTILSPRQVNQLRDRVSQLEKVADEQTRNRIIAGLIGGYFLGQKTISTAEKVFGE